MQISLVFGPQRTVWFDPVRLVMDGSDEAEIALKDKKRP